MESIEQEILASNSVNGTVFTKSMRVLARSATHLLVWVPGYTSYINRMSGSSYSQAAMYIFERRRSNSHKRICQGVRFKDKTLFTDPNRAALIDAVFGAGTAFKLSIDKTLVTEECEPFSKYGHELSSKGAFGYEKHEEIKKIRAELIANGFDQDEGFLHIEAERVYTERHKNDETWKERSDRLRLEAERQRQARWDNNEVTRYAELNKSQLEYLAEHFEMANDPIAQEIFAKVKELLSRSV